eukprot:scaffold257602_cov17-Tisochrysis_lutea.AAC.2
MHVVDDVFKCESLTVTTTCGDLTLWFVSCSTPMCTCRLFGPPEDKPNQACCAFCNMGSSGLLKQAHWSLLSFANNRSLQGPKTIAVLLESPRGSKEVTHKYGSMYSDMHACFPSFLLVRHGIQTCLWIVYIMQRQATAFFVCSRCLFFETARLQACSLLPIVIAMACEVLPFSCNTKMTLHMLPSWQVKACVDAARKLEQWEKPPLQASANESGSFEGRIPMQQTNVFELAELAVLASKQKCMNWHGWEQPKMEL